MIHLRIWIDRADEYPELLKRIPDGESAENNEKTATNEVNTPQYPTAVKTA